MMCSSKLRSFGALALVLGGALLAGCGEKGPGSPDGGDTPRLAGGGRKASDDPFVGGTDASGPGETGFPRIDPPNGLYAIFYADENCFEVPFERVIEDSAAFQEWWTIAVACLPHLEPPIDPPPPGLPPDNGFPPDDPPPGDQTDPGHGEGSAGSDSGVVDPEPGWPWDPFGPLAHRIDFTKNVVVVIGLETDALWGRSISVKSVENEGGVSTIRYEVVRPGDDCLELLMRPEPVTGVESSPVIAAVVPRPIESTVVFARSDTTFNCTWTPDPNEPLVLYYTDAACDLGAGESIVTEPAGWESWFGAAVACDVQRWGDLDEPIRPDGTIGEPGLPTPVDPPTRWAGIDVDFTTHAVIVLRGEPQPRWGGGIWLNAVEKGAGGTTIDYSVMEPGENCPSTESAAVLTPTVAIRLPLPLPEPVRFVRHAETIRCDWEVYPTEPGDPSYPPVGSDGTPIDANGGRY